jgi:shikimate kinase
VVGKLLSAKLGKDFIEMDEVIETRAGKKIVDIFAQEGEVTFRKLESQLLLELSAGQDLVVSCGGGLICNDKNLQVLKDTGTVFCLRASAPIIYERTTKYLHRPLLNVSDPLGKIEELLAARQPYYGQAHYTIDTDDISPEAVVDKIVDTLKEEKA